jgi:tripartite-type tricarboxylate transporter receptor subunit TctC
MTKLMNVVVAVALGLASAVAHAQAYPLKPVRMVVPFPPGGSNDIVARLIAQKLGEAFNQQFIIDNRGGAGGAIGAQTVARAAPDGYTIMLTNPGPAIHNVLLRKDPLYAISDFAPIVYIGSSASIVAATPKFPAANLKELVAFAKAHPGKVRWASAGINSNPHISLEVIRAATGIDVLHVPYKGTGAALTDTAAGEVDAVVTSIIAAEPFINAGRLKVLGYAGTKRASAIPAVATFTEQGINGANIGNWFGLVTGARTPRALINVLNDAVNKALQVSDVRQRLEQAGLEIGGGPPERLGALTKTETERISKLVRSGALRVEP